MKKQLFFALIMLTGISVYAQTKNNIQPKDGSSSIKLVEAYTQRILPGVQGSEPATESHFIVVWKNKTAPTTFFWRGSDGWMPCRVNMAHIEKNKKRSKDHWIVTQDIKLRDIKNGDTLEILPVAGGKNPIPKEVTADMTNMLFFKTGNPGWQYLPVKTISKKKDIVMP